MVVEIIGLSNGKIDPDFELGFFIAFVAFEV